MVKFEHELILNEPAPELSLDEFVMLGKLSVLHVVDFILCA